MAIEFDMFSIKDCGTINVLGIDYIVREVSDLHDGDEKLNGTVDLSACVIYIDNDQSCQSKTAAAAHEVVHIWDENLGLGFTEQQITALGSLIHGLVNETAGQCIDFLKPYHKAWVQLFDELRTITRYQNADNPGVNYAGHSDAKERMVAISDQHGISVWEEADS